MVDVNEALRALLINAGGLDPSVIDINYVTPTRQWASSVSRPTVNIYLYDIRENLTRRETRWQQIPDPTNPHRRIVKRGPLRIDLSYKITCWTTSPEDQHRLLWAALEVLLRHPELPAEHRQGMLRTVDRPVLLSAGQPSELLPNPTLFWSALSNDIRPSIDLVVTVELQLEEGASVPVVWSRLLRGGSLGTALEETLSIGGVVRDAESAGVPDVALRLLETMADGIPQQRGSSLTTDEEGRFVIPRISAGSYVIVVEAPGLPPEHRHLRVLRTPTSGDLFAEPAVIEVYLSPQVKTRME